MKISKNGFKKVFAYVFVLIIVSFENLYFTRWSLL